MRDNRGDRKDSGEIRNERGERKRGSNPLLNLFDTIDANGDGVLDKPEVEAYEVEHVVQNVHQSNS